MPQEELDHDLLRLELSGEPPQTRFVFVRRDAERQLCPELFGEFLLQAQGALVVECFVLPHQTEELAQLLLGRALHADEQSALAAGSAGPTLDKGIERLPAAQVEIADTEVRTVGQLENLLQLRQEGLLDVVKDARHASLLMGYSCGDLGERSPQKKRTRPGSPPAIGHVRLLAA